MALQSGHCDQLKEPYILEVKRRPLRALSNISS